MSLVPSQHFYEAIIVDRRIDKLKKRVQTPKVKKKIRKLKRKLNNLLTGC